MIDMQQLRARRPPTVLLMAAAMALLLRTVVPAGYMPAPLTSGWPVQICPDGLPVGAIAALLGQAHAHHHHGHSASSDDPAALPEQCELGAGFAASAAVSGVSLQTPGQFPLPLGLPIPSTDLAGNERPAFRPRAPPERLS